MTTSDVRPVHVQDIHENDASGNRVLVGFRVEIRYMDLIRCAAIELVGAQDDLFLKFEFGWTQGGPDKFRALILPILESVGSVNVSGISVSHCALGKMRSRSFRKCIALTTVAIKTKAAATAAAAHLYRGLILWVR
jgi:hypothetical protein